MTWSFISVAALMRPNSSAINLRNTVIRTVLLPQPTSRYRQRTLPLAATGTVATVLIAQLNTPEWADIAIRIAAVVVVGTALVTMIIAWRRNRDDDR